MWQRFENSVMVHPVKWSLIAGVVVAVADARTDLLLLPTTITVSEGRSSIRRFTERFSALRLISEPGSEKRAESGRPVDRDLITELRAWSHGLQRVLPRPRCRRAVLQTVDSVRRGGASSGRARGSQADS